MARLWTDGGEMGDVQFWDWVNDQGTIHCVTTPIPIGGEWCYEGAWLGAYKLTGSNLTEFYLRYRLRVNEASQAHGAYILGWRNAGSTFGRFSLDNIGRFCFYVGNTVVATAPLALAEDTWYLIELHVVIDNMAGRLEAYIDGTEFINFTGDTNPFDDLFTVDNIYWSTGAYTSVYLDDLALNDTTGLSDNSWCGDGIIVKMIPDGNGVTNDWHGSDGNDINNYELVDEYPNDGDVTYAYRDAVDAGTQDQYTLSDLDYTNKTVLRIWPEARARKTATGGTLKLGILPSGGVDDMSTAQILMEDYYARIIGKDYTVNPLDSGAWEEGDLDSLEVVAEIG